MKEQDWSLDVGISCNYTVFILMNMFRSSLYIYSHLTQPAIPSDVHDLSAWPPQASKKLRITLVVLVGVEGVDGAAVRDALDHVVGVVQVQSLGNKVTIDI